MTLKALRQSVFTSLRDGLKRHQVQVDKYQRRAGDSERRKALLDFAITGAVSGEPDRGQVTLRLQIGGDAKRGEARLEYLIDKIEEHLPTHIDPPDWTSAYDQDISSWVATGVTEAFRE